MNAQQFAHIVKGRRCGLGWVAKCPSHGDRTPSLGIRKSKKGHVLLRCFAGCDTKDILAALGLSLGDLYLDEQREAWLAKKREAERLCPAIRKPAERKPLGKLEATYRYTDKFGELVAEKLRYEGKVFLWRKPKLTGGWEWKVDRATLPLYLLHEIAQAHTIYLVEGEKDADRLRAAIPVGKRGGIAVTTAPNGSKSWKPDYAQWFRDRKVWIIPDSDAPGMEYAAKAARDIAPQAAAVRIVSVAPAKDVSDYLLTHSLAELSVLMREAKLWRKP